MKILIILTVCCIVYFICRGPKCPRCQTRWWDKGLFGRFWQCKWCGIYYDPILKDWKD